MVGEIVSPPRVGRVQAKECHLPEFRGSGCHGLRVWGFRGSGVLAFMGLRSRGLGLRGLGGSVGGCRESYIPMLLSRDP